jgi:hypothetical protein
MHMPYAVEDSIAPLGPKASNDTKSAGSKGSAAAINNTTGANPAAIDNTAGANPGGSGGQPAAAEPADELQTLKELMAMLEAENERLQNNAAGSKAGGDAPVPRRGRKRG